MSYTLPGGSAAHFQTATPGVGIQTSGVLHLVYDTSLTYTPPNGQAVNFNQPVGYAFPLGDAANFTLPGFATVTGNGAATITVTAEGHGHTGFRANGAATIAVTTEGHGTTFAPVRGNVRSGVANAWSGTAALSRAADASHPVTARSDQSKAAPWLKAQAADAEDTAAWLPPVRTDTGRDVPFGAFGEMLNEDRSSAWKPSKSADDLRSALWSIFGGMLNEDRGSRWVTAVPTDHRKTGAWRGHFITHRRIVPLVRPLGNAANFTVAGGGVDFWKDLSEGYTPPNGNAVFFQFGNEAYVPQPVTYPEFTYAIPKGDAANFLYNPAYEILLDGTGNPILDKSTADRTEVYPWGVSAHRDRDTDHPWTRYSRPLNPGWGIVVPAGPTPPVDGETITIPIQRVYVVINEIQLLRVSDMSPIPALNLNIGFDCDSWLPTFSATIPEAARDAVMPDPGPVEVEATINGSQFRFFVERIARSRAFAQRSVTIAGRGVACELDAPYAAQAQHTNTIDRTAQQIIDAALGFSGYTQTWNITDWLVPANTYSLFGTAAQVAADVAEASGSVLAADWSLRDLRMLPRYPVKPWEWAGATPDYVIPGAVTQTESLEWIEKPSYNVVYISGAQNGVLGQVKLTGTAGDLSAPMVTHPLITHADAARQRGIAVLGDTGRKAMLQISMPVLESTGVIDVCKLIEFNDGAVARRGIVRANSISVNWPTVRQTLTIEAAA